MDVQKRVMDGNGGLADATHAPVFYTLDVTRLAPHYLAPGFSILFRQSADRFAGRAGAWLELVHPADQDRVAAAISAANLAEPYTLRYRVLCPDGSIRHVCDQAQAAYRADRRWMRSGLIAQVNESPDAPEIFPHIGSAPVLSACGADLDSGFDERSERLRAAQKGAGIGVWVWDVAAGTTSWSPEVEALYGMEPGTFEGDQAAWMARVHPSDRKALEDAVAQFNARGGAFELEFRIRHPSGDTRWLASRGHVDTDSSGNAFAEDEVKLLAALAVDLAIGVRSLRLRAAHVATEEVM